ncbi:hypothetical protein CSKR_107362 [Clonorchis sinensis]|uniref:Uncharacterized protein n=1 Tax=Clonorchis sinensis TaxID=79923 RepID=A0A3R7FU43_CLOSI|nr:hypothetical protein CSKR_107362 [Clonorchis sinensis]
MLLTQLLSRGCNCSGPTGLRILSVQRRRRKPCSGWARWLQYLEREFTDRRVRGWNPTSASRFPLSKLGQLVSMSALVLPSGGVAAIAYRHRKCAAAERFFRASNEAADGFSGAVSRSKVFKSISRSGPVHRICALVSRIWFVSYPPGWANLNLVGHFAAAAKDESWDPGRASANAVTNQYCPAFAERARSCTMMPVELFLYSGVVVTSLPFLWPDSVMRCSNLPSE